MSFLDILTQAELRGDLSVTSSPATYSVSVSSLSPTRLKLLAALLSDLGYTKADPLDKMAQLEDQKRLLQVDDKHLQPGPWKDKWTRLNFEQEALLNLTMLLPASATGTDDTSI